MLVYRELKNISAEKKVVALGNFDGVHLGHRALINKTVDIANEKGLKSCVFSFYPHPKKYFNSSIKYLNTFETKMENTQKLGIDYLISIEFNQAIANLSKDEFIKEILVDKLNVDTLVVGYNYFFGKNREGNAEDLLQISKEFGIETIIIPPILVDEEIVSSSKIREYFAAGNIKKAASMLGYSPKIKGEVVNGNNIGGTKLGYRTANIEYEDDLLVPRPGVYFVVVKVDGNKFYGMCNIGYRPTIETTDKLTIEVHIVDFSENIYGEFIEIVFLEKIRSEVKFDSLDHLKCQLDKDYHQVKKLGEQFK